MGADVFVVEEVAPQDLDAVIRLAADTFPERYDEAFFFSMRELARDTFLVARDVATYRVQGFVLAVRQTHVEARLLLLAVTPARRGSGMGSRLLRDVEARLRQKGALSLSLEVREDNLAGIRFYHRLGYEIQHSIPSFYADGSKAVVMAKGL